MQHGALIWQRALAELQSIMTSQNYGTWLQNTRCVDFEGTVMTVGVPNTFNKEYLEKKIPHLIDKALQGLGYGHLTLQYAVVAGDSQEPSNKPKASRHGATTAGQNGSTAVATQPAQSTTPFFAGQNSQLNPRYVFETFIQGGGNRFAYAASMSVAEHPARRFNPLFIWGSVGLGKTHLLHAIGHEALRQHPHLQVLYTSSEKFMNEMIGAIQKGRTEEFRSRYRYVDILLIDDIQFIAGKESTQDEFFHTFNTLHEAQKQIVMTSDRHPKAMTTLEDRLRSRFEWGLIADVQPPDLEHRMAILQAKAELQPVPVPKSVIDYIARRVQSNVRELEGTLTRVTMMAAVQGTPVTLELAISALDAIAGGVRRSAPTLDEVMEAVLNYYKVERQAMLSTSRERAIALPRQVAMFLMREEAQCSLPRIGAYLGNRDHSTIMHGCEKVGSELKNENVQLRKDISAIRNALYETHDR
ncbi:MAG: chromosomal replication initiator protein DnaA [Chloroflexi bacterium]|nr:chromosomal replication initiator protein DnaA [Chloroflexota bacterium]